MARGRVAAVSDLRLNLVLAEDAGRDVLSLFLLEAVEGFRFAPDARPQSLGPQQHHPHQENRENQQPCVGRLAQHLGQSDDD